MNKKYLFTTVTILAASAFFLAACGSAATVTPLADPVIAATSESVGGPQAADPAAIVQNFYSALNAGDVDSAMTLVAEDVKCRGECYLDGKDAFRFLMQGTVNKGGRMEVKDLQVDGERVSYTWTAYNTDDLPVAWGTETLHIENGLIVLMETEEGTTPAAAEVAQPVDVVRQFYELLNAKDVTRAMQLTARDYIMNDPFGTYDRAAAAVQWQAVVDAGLSFNQTDFVDTGNGRVTSCYEVFENGKSVDKGCNNVTHIRNGKIIFDGLENAEQVWIVQKYYEALNAKKLDLAMKFIAPDALFINPTGTYEGAEAIRESLAGLNTDGITFNLSNFRNTNGTIIYDYEVLQGGNVLDKGTNGLTVVQDGLVIFDGTEETFVAR